MGRAMIRSRLVTAVFLSSLAMICACHGETAPDIPGPLPVEADPERFPDYPNCKPVVPGHNDRFESRVNWVLVGYQFSDPDKMRQVIADAVTFDEDSYWSLMNVKPFRSNRNKINLWYVDKRGTYRDMENIIQIIEPCVREDSLLRECPQFENEYVVIFQNTYDILRMAETVLHSCTYGSCENTAGGAFIGRGYIWIFSAYPFVPFPEGEEATRHYLAHEWGHIFGHLWDHYVSESSGDRVAGLSEAPGDNCRDRCGDQYKTYDELRDYDCARHCNATACNQDKMEFLPCYWFEGGCVNVLEYCSRYETEESCLDVPFCGFLRNIQPESWHRSHCVSYNTGLDISDAVKDDRYDIYVETAYPVIDVGLDCEEGTGCYNCANRHIGRFRADAFTLMRQDFLNSYGAYQNALVEDIMARIIEGDYDDGFWEFHEGRSTGGTASTPSAVRVEPDPPFS